MKIKISCYDEDECDAISNEIVEHLRKIGLNVQHEGREIDPRKGHSVTLVNLREEWFPVIVESELLPRNE